MQAYCGCQFQESPTEKKPAHQRTLKKEYYYSFEANLAHFQDSNVLNFNSKMDQNSRTNKFKSIGKSND